MQTITPRSVTGPVAELCRRLVGEGAVPTYLEVAPVEHAELGECFPAVQRQVVEHGGTMRCGWAIWELPRVYVEAEFHAVWQDPSGHLVNITPVEPGISRVLFLPDPARSYQGRQVNNVRLAVLDHPAVHDMFRACDDAFELMNRGERQNQHDLVRLTPSEGAEMLEIQQRKFQAMDAIRRLVPPPGRNDPCHCGSGQKFKKCCGR